MIEKFLKQELTGWKTWEAVYLFSAVGITIAAGYQGGDNALGTASAVTGTLYTMLAGKGKVSCYIFGIFNTIAYGYIAGTQQLYGDRMLNWGIYLPILTVKIFLAILHGHTMNFHHLTKRNQFIPSSF